MSDHCNCGRIRTTDGSEFKPYRALNDSSIHRQERCWIERTIVENLPQYIAPTKAKTPDRCCGRAGQPGRGPAHGPGCLCEGDEECRSECHCECHCAPAKASEVEGKP